MLSTCTTKQVKNDDKSPDSETTDTSSEVKSNESVESGEKIVAHCHNQDSIDEINSDSQSLSYSSDIFNEQKNAPSIEEIKNKISVEVNNLVDWTLRCDALNFLQFENQLINHIFALAKLFVLLFFARREQTLRANGDLPEGYKWQTPRGRLLGTFFGKVRYWRSYLYCKTKSGGYYPLDLELGLTADGFSLKLQGLAARIATKVSYAQSVLLLRTFLNWSPCQKSIEEMVLGLGRHTTEWFEQLPPPKNDGKVLVIQIDSKGTPTATEEELNKRRGKRSSKDTKSKRHRGKDKRKKKKKKKRRKKGNKSKNAKMATIVVMYTLEAGENGQLEGPINKKVYASYAPKRHAVAIARREADKRGFESENGKLVQIVTDGDNDLATYIEELFPEAIHTIDVYHVTEYIWEAGYCLHKEGSDELYEWVEQQKSAIYDGRAGEVVEEIERKLKQVKLNEAKTKRLQKIRNYLAKRIKKMDYKALREQDLEISSGAVEGAVNYVIAKRFDSGGMRWIKERAEALLQLRCIEVNGDWDAFMLFVHDKMRDEGHKLKKNLALKSKEAAPLPIFGLN